MGTVFVCESMRYLVLVDKPDLAFPPGVQFTRVIPLLSKIVPDPELQLRHASA